MIKNAGRGGIQFPGNEGLKETNEAMNWGLASKNLGVRHFTRKKKEKRKGSHLVQTNWLLYEKRTAINKEVNTTADGEREGRAAASRWFESLSRKARREGG